MPKPINTQPAGLIIARAALHDLQALNDESRAQCYEVLATITPQAEAEQFAIAANALRASAEAQMLLTEILTQPAGL